MVRGGGTSLLSVYEPQDTGELGGGTAALHAGKSSSGTLTAPLGPSWTAALCTKEFSYQEAKLQRLCVAEQCQCMAGEQPSHWPDGGLRSDWSDGSPRSDWLLQPPVPPTEETWTPR